MNTDISVVADGRERLMRALPSTVMERKRRLGELILQLEAQHRDQLGRAGFFGRVALRRKIREEAAAVVRREFGVPSNSAQFFAVGQRANKTPEPTPLPVMPRAEPRVTPGSDVAHL